MTPKVSEINDMLEICGLAVAGKMTWAIWKGLIGCAK